MSNAELFVLVQTIAESLRIWVKRGEVALTEDQIMERARNCADSLRSTFMIIPLPAEPIAPEWHTPLIVGPAPRHMYGCHCGQCPGEFQAKPIGHSWSCRCDKCDLVNRSVKQ